MNYPSLVFLIQNEFINKQKGCLNSVYKKKRKANFQSQRDLQEKNEGVKQ